MLGIANIIGKIHNAQFDILSIICLSDFRCVIVGESCETNSQFVVPSVAKKPLTCLDVSADGKYIVTGEVSWYRIDTLDVWIYFFLLDNYGLCLHTFSVLILSLT